VNYQPYFYFNIDGLILYTSIDPISIPLAFPVAKALAKTQAAQLANGVTTTLSDYVGKVAVDVEEAETAETEEDAIVDF
jgi:hypothetical protein